MRMKIIGALSCLLVSALLLTGCGAIPSDSEFKDIVKDFLVEEKDDSGGSDTSGNDNTGTDSGTVTLPNTGGSEEPSTDSTLHCIEYTGKSEDGALKTAVFGANVNGDTADLWSLAFHTTELKPNTKYKVSWSFNANFQFNSNAKLWSYTDDQNVIRYYIRYSPAYVAGSDQLMVHSPNPAILMENSFEFTSGAEGSDFIFAPVWFDTVKKSDAIDQAKVFLDFVNYIYVQEVK